MSLTLAKATPAQVSTPKSGYLAVFINASDGDKMYAKDHLGNLYQVGGGGLDKVGDLGALTTTNKSSAVLAINETLARIIASHEENTYTVDQLRGNDETGEKGGLPFQTIDAILPHLNVGDKVYVMAGDYSIANSILADEVVWVFDERGGTVVSSGNMFLDSGVPMRSSIYAKKWSFTSLGVNVFLTGESYVYIECDAINSLTNLGVFHSCPTTNTFLKIKANSIFGAGSYAISARAFACGEISADAFISSNGYAVFFRSNGSDYFSGTYTINSPQFKNTSINPVINSIYASPLANVTINGDIIGTVGGGIGFLISDDGKYTINGNISSHINPALYVGAGLAEVTINGEMKTTDGNDCVVGANGANGSIIFGANCNVKMVGTSTSLSGNVELTLGASAKIVFENGFSVTSETATNCVRIKGVDGRVIFNNAKLLTTDTTAGLKSIQTPDSHPNIHFRGVIFTNKTGDLGTPPVFDFYGSFGSSGLTVDASIID